MNNLKKIAKSLTVLSVFVLGIGMPMSSQADDVIPNQTDTYQTLANQDYQVGQQAYDILNNDQPETITSSNFKQSKIDYSNLDNFNRAGTATAYLTKDNLGKSKGRASQIFKPTGWSNQAKKINGERVFPVNRGHLIAYTFSFNLDQSGNYSKGRKGSIDNPKNLFTQSAFSNQKIMQLTEDNVRDALSANKKVIYQVTPVYRGNDLMARGVWVQAISTDGSLHFDRYLYNVQPGLAFNYANGRSTLDGTMTVPNPPEKTSSKKY